MTALSFFAIPTPRDLFRWYALIPIAAVATAWPAMSAAIDRAHAEVRRESGVDWPRPVLATAAFYFPEFSVQHEALRHMASMVWTQLEAQQ